MDFLPNNLFQIQDINYLKQLDAKQRKELIDSIRLNCKKESNILDLSKLIMNPFSYWDLLLSIRFSRWLNFMRPTSVNPLYSSASLRKDNF